MRVRLVGKTPLQCHEMNIFFCLTVISESGMKYTHKNTHAHTHTHTYTHMYTHIYTRTRTQKMWSWILTTNIFLTKIKAVKRLSMENMHAMGIFDGNRNHRKSFKRIFYVEEVLI
jgi:hypothetical protein